MTRRSPRCRSRAGWPCWRRWPGSSRGGPITRPRRRQKAHVRRDFLLVKHGPTRYQSGHGVLKMPRRLEPLHRRDVLRVRWLAVFACLLGAFALGMTACGDDDDDGGDGGGAEGGGGAVNVYSSLPLQGSSSPQTTAMVDGIKLALEEAGGKAGDTTIKYTSLDDSTAQAGTWTPEATSANARKVAQDDAAVAYIGEFNSGASAISIPILNEVPIAQVSPANTAVGLTTDEPGADEGEPEKYYPSGERHYLRIVPKDTIQGAALATVMKEDGCTSTYILNDKEVYGAGLASNIEIAAKEQGLEIAGNEGIDPKEGGIPADVANKVKLTVATLSPDEYPPEGQKFFDDYEAKYGEPNPDPYSIYGYEAMSLVLDTCEELGPDCSDKQAMIDGLFNTKGRKSVLGTYDIDENGDTTLTDYGVYTVKEGELVFEQSVKAGG